jgi:hypothetical protein
MTNEEKLKQIAHYEWMLDTMTLNPSHEWWIKDKMEDLKEGLKTEV